MYLAQGYNQDLSEDRTPQPIAPEKVGLPSEVLSFFGFHQLIIQIKTRNDITTLALYGHGSEAILFFSMWQGKVIHFPIITWFYKHFLWDILQ